MTATVSCPSCGATHERIEVATPSGILADLANRRGEHNKAFFEFVCPKNNATCVLPLARREVSA